MTTFANLTRGLGIESPGCVDTGRGATLTLPGVANGAAEARGGALKMIDGSQQRKLK